ncbi:MAG: methylated-DNA--[protein]-cysteine S-methyltransferase [Phycisphaerales bacterium]
MSVIASSAIVRTLQTPIGPVLSAASPRGLERVHFSLEPIDAPSSRRASGPHDPEAVLAGLAAWMEWYAAGGERAAPAGSSVPPVPAASSTRSAPRMPPMAPAATPFQAQVRAALLAIPTGETRTYGQVAAAIGRPSAARAVGMANARNPLGIIVPCHRVIGASGTLTGYAGGLAAKARLLDHERGGAEAADHRRMPA